MNKKQELLQIYRKKKSEIARRLGEFRQVWDRSDKEIFAELCFCLLTPQSKAESCDGIICKLKENDLLYQGSLDSIMPYVKNARFYKNKSRYIIEARQFLQENGRINIKGMLNTDDTLQTREWLVKHIKGIGYKEASHFLRNIGFGQKLAILDVHILKNLKELGVIREIPKTLSMKQYLAIESKVRDFSRKIHIPMAHLDLLFWYRSTNRIFK